MFDSSYWNSLRPANCDAWFAVWGTLLECVWRLPDVKVGMWSLVIRRTPTNSNDGHLSWWCSTAQAGSARIFLGRFTAETNEGQPKLLHPWGPPGAALELPHSCESSVRLRIVAASNCRLEPFSIDNPHFWGHTMWNNHTIKSHQFKASHQFLTYERDNISLDTYELIGILMWTPRWF